MFRLVAVALVAVTLVHFNRFATGAELAVPKDLGTVANAGISQDGKLLVVLEEMSEEKGNGLQV